MDLLLSQLQLQQAHRWRTLYNSDDPLQRWDKFLCSFLTLSYSCKSHTQQMNGQTYDITWYGVEAPAYHFWEYFGTSCTHSSIFLRSRGSQKNDTQRTLLHNYEYNAGLREGRCSRMLCGGETSIPNRGVKESWQEDPKVAEVGISKDELLSFSAPTRVDVCFDASCIPLFECLRNIVEDHTFQLAILVSDSPDVTLKWTS